MLELNHIIKGEDLLSGSSGPQTHVMGSSEHLVFDLKAGGLFKIDAPNADRAQIATLETTWNSSSH